MKKAIAYQLETLFNQAQELSWNLCSIAPYNKNDPDSYWNDGEKYWQVSKRLIEHNDSKIKALREKFIEMRRFLIDNGLIKN